MKILDIIFTISYLIITYFTLVKLSYYSIEDNPKFSDGKTIISLPKLTLLWHSITLYLLQMYLTLIPYFPYKRHSHLTFWLLIILSNYFLIIPYHDKIGSIKGNLAIIINHVVMICLLLLIFYFYEYNYESYRYICLFILNIPSFLVMKSDFIKYIGSF